MRQKTVSTWCGLVYFCALRSKKSIHLVGRLSLRCKQKKIFNELCTACVSVRRTDVANVNAYVHRFPSQRFN